MKAVTDLLEICFTRHNDKDSKRYIASLRRASQNESYLRWASMTRDTALPLQGFVWVENGTIVGNVHLIRFKHRRKRIYMIANVAVHPDYRRRGIGRALVFQAMQQARQKGCESIWLQVRDDNGGAIELYEQLGFTTQASRTTWVVVPEYQTHILPSNTAIRPRIPTDWPFQKRWLRQAYPPRIEWFFPVQGQFFSPWRWPLRFIADTTVRQWSVLEHNQLQGILAWLPGQGRRDSLWLAAPPNASAQAVTALLRHAQKNLSTRQELRLDYPAGQHHQAILSAGFKPLRTLLWMQAAGSTQNLLTRRKKNA